MYHRFNENKYPSTNIKMEVFKRHIELISKENLEFYNLKEFDENFSIPKKDKKILITVDDAFLSFYDNAWPFLKKKTNSVYIICFYWTSRKEGLYDLGTNYWNSKRGFCNYR